MDGQEYSSDQDSRLVDFYANQQPNLAATGTLNATEAADPAAFAVELGSNQGTGKVVDFTMAEQFLTLLDPGPNPLFSFQTFDDGRDEPKRAALTKVLHATRDQLPAVLPKLQLLNAGGAGVFVTVNATNGNGRKGGDIVGVRALFIDLDGAPLEPVLTSERPPHIVTATSPGRYHAYWLVEGMSLEDFRGTQEALLEKFGGDRNVKSVEHVMRVPGFFHRKGAPFLCRIHTVNQRPHYRADEFEKKPQPLHVPNADSDDEVNLKAAREAVIFIPNPNLEWEEWNTIGMAIFRATGGSEDGFDIFDRWSRRSAKYNARTTRARWAHYFRSPPERIGIGSLIHLATKAVPDWHERLDYALWERVARQNYGVSFYELCGIATPEEQAAGAPLIKKRAPGLRESEAQNSGKEKPTAELPPPQPDPPPQPEPPPPPPPPPAASKSGLVVVRLADVPAEKVNWFWKERIARGMLSVFAGMPDVNKSTAFLDLAARATNGGHLPAGEGQVPHGSVIILTAEDTLANTVRPRLEVAGADLTRIHVIRMVEKVEGQHPARSFDLTRDIRRLEILIKEIGDVVLVGIDPVSAYMGKPGKLDSHRETDIRGTLMPLGEMAERRNVAIIGINHLNKNSSTEAMLRIVGSIAFVGGPRAAYFIVRDDEDDDRRLFLPVKNNISKIRTGLAFRVIDKLAPPPVFDAYPAIKWEEQTITMTADEALAAKPDGRKSEKLEAAKALIAEILANEPRPATTIEERAAAQGITAKSLRNAKAALFVRAAQAGGRWWWYLPGQEPPM